MKNLAFRFLLFILLVLGNRVLKAQNAPTVAWDKSFGANLSELFTCMQLTDDGGFIFGGTSTSHSNGDKTDVSRGGPDYWVVKTDSKGNKQWDKTFGGAFNDNLFSICQTSDGGYMLAGESASLRSGDKSKPTTGPWDLWIIKLDTAGNKVWNRTIGGNLEERFSVLKPLADGGFILGGQSNSPASGEKSEANKGYSGTFDYWLLKLDASGNKIWDKTIGGFANDYLYSIEQTADGGYILGGSSSSDISGDKSQNSRGYDDYWVVKLDANGNKIWDKTLGGNLIDGFPGVIQTADGGYFVAGSSTSGITGDKSQSSKGGLDFWVVKLDVTGNKIWDKTIGGNGSDSFGAIQQASDGGFLIGGTSDSGISGDKTQAPKSVVADFWLVKLDANGTKLWDKTIGGNNYDDCKALFTTPDGGFVLGGTSASGSSADKTQASRGETDYWLVKLNAPCSNLSARIIPECIVGGTKLTLEVKGIQEIAGKYNFTLNYTENGISKTISDSVSSRTLAFNPSPGAVFNLVNITSGICSITLNQTATMPAFPAAPVANSAKRCGSGSVTLTASGAPAGSKYIWYDVPTGGSPLQTDSVGIFKTPELNEPTLYYVAIQNELGCEGPRTQILASLDYCLPTFIPNIITQNNDGKNETFQPQNLTSGKWQLQIFNRWGTKIYESKDYQNTWPETEIAAGTYYYLLVNSETNQKFKGWLEVLK